MKWAVVAPFFLSEKDVWIDDFTQKSKHQFIHISAPASGESSWHDRSKFSGLFRWMGYWQQSSKAMSSIDCEGYITVFPQLAIIIGIRQRFRRKKKPIVAWCFNLGGCYQGLRQKISRFALKDISRFIVHSTSEVNEYSTWLGLPKDRFVFVPLQRRHIDITHGENTLDPFILSMGSAKRDYKTFFDCVRKLNLRTIVVAGESSLSGLAIPDCVEVKNRLTHEQCLVLAQQARINVVPVDNEHTASGQVTFLEAMRMGKAVVVTNCIGSRDYIMNHETGILVEPKSAESLCDAITLLWNDNSLRNRIGENAKMYSNKYFSDEAVARLLTLELDELESNKIG